MVVLRRCVQRHARLPATLVVDGGSEFASCYFETLLARYSITKKTRPSGKARFGSVIERLFGTAHTTFIYTLRGNTQLTRNVRQVTQAVAPHQQACWTLEHLDGGLREWADQYYDTTRHPALGQSPRAAAQQGMQHSGARPQCLIPYNETFWVWTLPTTPRGTAQVRPGMGVKIHGVYYWCDAFRDPCVERTQVPIRYDPSDAGVAMAAVQGHWHRCISQYYAIFQGRSEREIVLATQELRRQHQQQARHAPITARALATFLESVAAEELLLLQRLRDAAVQATQTDLTVNPGELTATPGAPGTPTAPPVIASDGEAVAVPDLHAADCYEEY